jgi:uncharacterized membrane protein YsdA (DUF1294 family)
MILSGAAFALYGYDKFTAKAGMGRIPERSLFLISIIGGGFGGLAAMILFRHKIRKTSFWLVNGGMSLVWLLVLILFNK